MKEYDKMMLRSRKQMSETNMLMILLTISGGLQDAYSYFERGEVFSTAQTGNIVLMSTYVAKGNWHRALHYLIPVLAFAMGIFIAERLHARFKDVGFIHWRQIIVFTEMVLLCIVGFIPLGGSYDFVANALSSCACAMQVQTFRKMGGYSYASTMCIGNLRSGTAAFSHYLQDRKTEQLKQAAYYFGIIFLFAIGAGLGGNLTEHFGIHMIWISCILLGLSFLLMFENE